MKNGREIPEPNVGLMCWWCKGTIHGDCAVPVRVKGFDGRWSAGFLHPPTEAPCWEEWQRELDERRQAKEPAPC